VGAATAVERISANVFIGQAHLRQRGMVAFAADIIASLGILVFIMPLPSALRPLLALLGGGLVGLGGGTFQTIWVTLLHELVPNEKLGRVASIDLLGSFCLQPFGFALAGIVADHLVPTWVFLAAGLLNLALYSAPLATRAVRAAE